MHDERVNLVKAYQITVYGRVQGVGFRWSTVRLAEQLSIVGTVKNQRMDPCRLLRKERKLI